MHPESWDGSETRQWPIALIASLCIVVLASLELLFGLSEIVNPERHTQTRILLALLLAGAVGFTLWRQIRLDGDARRRQRWLSQELVYTQTLLDNINDAVATEDLSGRVLFANKEFYRLLAVKPAARDKLRLEDLVHPDDLEQRRIHRQRCLEGGWSGTRFEHRGLRRDGAALELESSLTPLKLGGVLVGMQWVMRDISRRRLIEKSQRAIAQRLEFFVSEMPLGCVIWDQDFRVQEWNESAARIFGWTHSEVLSRRYADFLSPPENRQEAERLWQRLQCEKMASRRLCENHTKHRGRIECEWFHTSLINDTGQVVAVASMVQDVTERRSLERQLLQSQKMEAVGTLAGGIAHDFNNLLTTILGHTSLALMKLGPSHAASSGLRDAEKAAERAAELTQQLLRFGRKAPPELKPLDLNHCIQEVVGLLKHGIDAQVEIEVDLAPDLWPVEADPGQVEQVLMNLCVNARDAICGQGRIRIRSANRVSVPASRGHLSEYVEVTVEDDGCGMDAEIRSRVFEPFFSTKEVGKGTGLGLSMVYSIVKSHSGSVDVSSTPGKGSTFQVCLPRTHRSPAVEESYPEPDPRRGEETVLLADDEDSVRGLARQILEGQGHAVLEARDGQEALEMFTLHRDRLGLVILDLTMPRKSGWEAFDEIHRLGAGVPVIVASGYSLDGGSDAAIRRGAKAFLQKPYKTSGLLSVVRDALDNQAAGAVDQPAAPARLGEE